MASDLTGQTIGSFYIERILGKGAMGAVYLGRHKEKGYVAIKVVDPGKREATPTMLQRFEREIGLLKRFNHKHLVKFRDAGVHNGLRYYAMEYVEGETLEAILAKKERLPVSTACQLIWQLCDALEEMHSEGVVHRDLKPANVMVDKNGTLKLTDLGIAKDTSQVFNSTLTEADTTVGTVAYMAPEQLAGKDLSRRSDLYSMGIMFYQLLTGRLPFTGRTVYEYINQRQAGAFPRPAAINTKIPYELDQLVVELMKQDPEERPRDARVVQQRIKEIADKSRQGTLTKTAPMEGQDLAATEVMKAPPKPGVWKATSMAASTLTRTLVGSGSRKKKRASGEPFWESPLFLVGLLLLTLGGVWWAMRPLGEEQLFARGKELMESNHRSDWDLANEKYFAPLLERFPESKHRPRIESYRDQILVVDCEKKVEWARKIGRLPENASEGFRRYFEADSLRLLANKQLANEQFKAIATLFENDPNERGWAMLARQQLVDEGKAVAEDPSAAKKREAVADAIGKANELRKAGKAADYFRIADAILSLYASDPDVADLVKKLKEDVDAARRVLQGKS